MAAGRVTPILEAASPFSSELRRPAQEDLGSIERLGETTEFRSLLLKLLRLQGWTVDERPAFGGGWLVIASKNGVEVCRKGDSLAEISTEVFKEATRAQALGIHEPVQLELG
jgi:hypothetical protein